MSQITLEESKLPSDGQGSEILHAGQSIGVFRVGDDFFAMENDCPHQGAQLSDGWMDGTVVACPWHCWQFDVATGQCLTVSGMDLKTYPVVTENGAAQITLPDD